MEGESAHEEIEMVEGEEVVYDETVVAVPYRYDSVFSYSQERNLLFDLYQPEETPEGTFVCKICLRTGRQVEFTEKNVFVAHRYKCHGSYNNNISCPVFSCREVFASMTSLRRHLVVHHDLPLEVHQQGFANVGEFEKWRHLIELSSGCRFMMHTKQPKLRRQVMHCARSEHKLVMQTNKHRLPRYRMEKEGSCCPAHISFRIEERNGEVQTFSQLYHIGHAPRGNDQSNNEMDTVKPIDFHFPIKPKYYADRPLQYVQIDIYDMTSALYGTVEFGAILLVSDLKTGFLWARPLSEITRSIITRLLVSIFTEHGNPEGFSTSYSPTYIRDAMKSIGNVFSSEIREIWCEPPVYEELEQWVILNATNELGGANRWVEQLQFVVMEYNQRTYRDFVSPFEKLFKRKPPKLYDDDENNSDIIIVEKDRHGRIINHPREDENILASEVNYLPGERVYLKRLVKKTGRGSNLPYYFGYIAEYDKKSKFFPYKVHYSSNDNPWPSEANIFAWASVYDILPTIHKLQTISDEERQKILDELFCSCGGIESRQKYDFSSYNVNKERAQCLLYRNIMCSNGMARACCKAVGRKQCLYHTLYPTSDDSYTKLETTLVTFKKMEREAELAETATTSAPTTTMRAQLKQEEEEEEEEEEEVEEEEEEEEEEGEEVVVEVEEANYEYEPEFSRSTTTTTTTTTATTTTATSTATAATTAATSTAPTATTKTTATTAAAEAVATAKKRKLARNSKKQETTPKIAKEETSSPTPSESLSIRSTRSTSPTKRQSNRKTVRPKNLSDYV